MAATQRREEERAQFREQMKELDARGLIIVDECGSNIALTPRYGWAPKGQRVQGSVPRNRGKNVTLIASLGWDGMGESMILEGGTTAAIFEQYIEQILAPTLLPGQIVVLNNLSCHKGCQLLFLPAYSPDFSPIEETFSKLKAFLRRVGARTRDALEEAIGQALLTVTEGDAQGWFRHCGYVPHS
ncbi:MAG TPA: transposase [Ktedonobacteraceae bacterium]|nr:transposase [Ktedonobacteraceae bacterium]